MTDQALSEGVHDDEARAVNGRARAGDTARDPVRHPARVIPLRPFPATPDTAGADTAGAAPARTASAAPAPTGPAPVRAAPVRPAPDGERRREPLWRDLVGGVLRRERLAQGRTLQEVAGAARISMPYLSEVERGRKEASSEVLAAAAHALGLGLADLLSRAHGELGHVHSRTGSVAHPGGSRHGGLCLAA